MELSKELKVSRCADYYKDSARKRIFKLAKKIKKEYCDTGKDWSYLFKTIDKS